MRELALRPQVREQGPGPECSKLARRAPAAAWGTMVRVARERNFAQARMKTKAEVPRRRALEKVKWTKAAKERELLRQSWLRWLRVQALARTPQELTPKQQEPTWWRLENPRVQELMQARRVAKPREQAGHSRTLRAPAPGQKLQERTERAKNSARPPRSQRAWAALGRAALLMRQASPAGRTSSPAERPLALTKWVARKQDWRWLRSPRRDAR